MAACGEGADASRDCGLLGQFLRAQDLRIHASERLQLVHTQEEGRSVAAQAPIRAGEIIMEDTPYLSVVRGRGHCWFPFGDGVATGGILLPWLSCMCGKPPVPPPAPHTHTVIPPTVCVCVCMCMCFVASVCRGFVGVSGISSFNHLCVVCACIPFNRNSPPLQGGLYPPPPHTRTHTHPCIHT